MFIVTLWLHWHFLDYCLSFVVHKYLGIDALKLWWLPVLFKLSSATLSIHWWILAAAKIFVGVHILVIFAQGWFDSTEVQVYLHCTTCKVFLPQVFSTYKECKCISLIHFWIPWKMLLISINNASHCLGHLIFFGTRVEWMKKKTLHLAHSESIFCIKSMTEGNITSILFSMIDDERQKAYWFY